MDLSQCLRTAAEIVKAQTLRPLTIRAEHALKYLQKLAEPRPLRFEPWPDDPSEWPVGPTVGEPHKEWLLAVSTWNRWRAATDRRTDIPPVPATPSKASPTPHKDGEPYTREAAVAFCQAVEDAQQEQHLLDIVTELKQWIAKTSFDAYRDDPALWASMFNRDFQGRWAQALAVYRAHRLVAEQAVPVSLCAACGSTLTPPCGAYSDPEGRIYCIVCYKSGRAHSWRNATKSPCKCDTCPPGPAAAVPENRDTFIGGAMRETQAGKTRYDLLSPIFLRRVATAMTSAAARGTYADRNWEKGYPQSRSMASLLRHINAFREGNRDEDHLAKAACNLMFLIHTEEAILRGLLPTALDDLPTYAATSATALPLAAGEKP
jgi:hypothetical protein